MSELKPWQDEIIGAEVLGDGCITYRVDRRMGAHNPCLSVTWEEVQALAIERRDALAENAKLRAALVLVQKMANRALEGGE
jgi:hypothetical protein